MRERAMGPTGQRRLGGFSCDMALVGTNTVKGKRASAVFALKGEASVIEQISEIVVTDDRNGVSYFRLPLSHEEVLGRFRARASKEELRQLQELRLSRDPESQERAVELVLFKLTPDELWRIGVYQEIMVPADPHGFWIVASGSCVHGIPEAVNVVLSNGRIDAGSGGMCGGIHWSVHREQFFRARRVLLAAEDPRVRACAARPPEFKFE